MNIAEYYDSVASFWDDDFAEAQAAREMLANLSVPRAGARVLDVGCGCGSMFLPLLDCGACEIDGLDISPKMAEIAREKFLFDPRIHVEQEDFLAYEHGGYDLITVFYAYHHFVQPRIFLRQAHKLLRPGGRLSIAFPFDKERMNVLSAALPAGLARGLLSAEEEAVFWRELFRVDCLCDTDNIFLLSGITK